MTDRPTALPDDESSRAGKTRFSWRAVHRAKAHSAAHDGESGGLEAPVAPKESHELVPEGPASLILTDAALRDLIERLRQRGVFAYDSEFIGELSYHPRLCLIQVASAKEVALIDPMAPIDLQPFWELLADPSVQKIVHAGSQDVEPVVRHLGRGPANLFDTQVAAGLASFPYPVSLSKLVLELAGAKLGKGLTFSHWDQRPLSKQQLRYAADDVRYLPRVHAILTERLQERGFLDYVAEEGTAMCEPSQYRFNPDVQWLRIRGAGSLDGKQARVLQQLVVWRNDAAKEADVPPRSFLKDEILIDLSRNPVRSTDKLQRIKGLPRPVELQHGQIIVDATAKGLAAPPLKQPGNPLGEPSASDKFRGDALLSAAQTMCYAKGIDPALVGSRADFSELFYRLRDRGELDGLHVMSGWRRKAIGDELVNLFRGQTQAAFKWNDTLCQA